jgi:UDP-N-acetyl-D-mannosaminuronic acid dehydrogenase
MCPTLEETVKDVDAILLLVRHAQFRELDPAKVAALTSTRLAVDTVNAWDPSAWKKEGFHVFRLGDGKQSLS